MDRLFCPELWNGKPLDPGFEAVCIEVCPKNTSIMREEKGHQDLQISNLNTDRSSALLRAMAS